MRHQLLRTVLVALPLFAAACATDEGPTPFDDEFPVSADNFNEGAPPNNTLPDDNKADAVYPKQFEVKDQSPVKSQGSRGVCSIFAATALVENLYIKAGMPVDQADFSEQYMQWSVKTQVGSFANTEGSSGDSNLKSVVRFGTVPEAAWPYETSPWTAANDAACTGGENLPTKCYTNGEPPASATSATKLKLPSSRWINTNSMKAHLTTKKTGIVVGFTFFYQSWNHRRSTLPVSTELWQKGVVTYPNAKDKAVSLEKRAGHAIEIVGWDDDIEFPMRDEAGNPVLDASGNARKEKGFWIFKNSWGTASFGVDHPTGAGYGYLSMKYIAEYGSAVVAELPSLGPVTPPPTGGGTTRTYNGTGGLIPDDDATGVSSTIEVTDQGTLDTVSVTVDATHTYRGDLKVVLTHGSFTTTLVDGEGGSADDLKKTFSVAGLGNAQLSGSWTLTVIDTAAQDEGTLNNWKLETKTR